ncbi:uncharacterized protein LOC144440224 [Glandiceps talaboti]
MVFCISTIAMIQSSIPHTLTNRCAFCVVIWVTVLTSHISLPFASGQRLSCTVGLQQSLESSSSISAVLWKNSPPNKEKCLTLETTFTTQGDIKSSRSDKYMIDVVFTSTSTLTAIVQINDSVDEGTEFMVDVFIAFPQYDTVSRQCTFDISATSTSVGNATSSSTPSDYLGTTTTQWPVPSFTSRPSLWLPTTSPSVYFKQDSTTKSSSERNASKPEERKDGNAGGMPDVYMTITIVLSIAIGGFCIIVPIVLVLRRRGYFRTGQQLESSVVESVDTPAGLQHSREDIENAQQLELVYLKMNTDYQDIDMLKSFKWTPVKADKNEESVPDVDCG